MTGSILLEFPPVICGKSLFLLKNNGALYAISRRTGKVRWKAKLGYLAAVVARLPRRRRSTSSCSRAARASRRAASSAVAGVHAAGRAGRASCPAAPSPRRCWTTAALYFGSEDGTVYALDAANGDIVWTYKAGGAVKGAIALDGDGRLFFGDYAGSVTAIRRADGKRLWKTGHEPAARSA